MFDRSVCCINNNKHSWYSADTRTASPPHAWRTLGTRLPYQMFLPFQATDAELREIAVVVIHPGVTRACSPGTYILLAVWCGGGGFAECDTLSVPTDRADWANACMHPSRTLTSDKLLLQVGVDATFFAEYDMPSVRMDRIDADRCIYACSRSLDFPDFDPRWAALAGGRGMDVLCRVRHAPRAHGPN